MEYLSRVLSFVTAKMNFKYHALCGQLKLTHLMLADDLLLFIKGDIGSIMILLRVYATFSAASGVQMNTLKSNIYFNGVATDVKDSLWVKWVNHIYIKGANWTDYTPKQDSSWSWKSVCRVKDQFKQVYSTGTWTLQPKGYSMNSGYQHIRFKFPEVSWHKCIWNKWRVPKHSFINWIIIREALPLKDRLVQYGVCTDDRCCICSIHAETHTHLFQQCDYNKA
ncbi:uncharacterized protein LOC141655410 [Silene latifolia]|uniref:uncharacterized protein LOC141655410 n=1 Tax=Silene latifolia TaxID=37657 RepID=UPI003D779750